MLCADCETPLTACWSKGNTALHPYYLCPKKGCDSYGKSVRRDKIEGEFQTLLQSVQPTEGLFRVARAMFRDAWAHRAAQAETQTKALKNQLAKIDGQVSQLLTRILDTSVPSVIGAYEEKVQKLESDKLLIKEKLATSGRPVSSFDDTLRTALSFLANPCNLWSSEQLEDRRAVLKLTFAERLRYKRNEGFRTPDLSLPFKVLSGFLPDKNEMARPTGYRWALRTLANLNPASVFTGYDLCFSTRLITRLKLLLSWLKEEANRRCSVLSAATLLRGASEAPLV